jgi:hypothetical protein
MWKSCFSGNEVHFAHFRFGISFQVDTTAKKVRNESMKNHPYKTIEACKNRHIFEKNH